MNSNILTHGIIAFALLILISCSKNKVPTPAISGLNALYIRGIYYCSGFDYLLTKSGFNVTISDNIPNQSILARYNIVIVNSYTACNSTTADYLGEYLFNGGGVVLISGTPYYFGLQNIRNWFGASYYVNSGGKAYYYGKHVPFNVFLADGSLLTDHTGSESDAAVTGVLDTTHILGKWEDGSVICFWNTYGAGRLFYHGSMYCNLPQLNEYNNGLLWTAGIKWVARMENMALH